MDQKERKQIRDYTSEDERQKDLQVNSERLRMRTRIRFVNRDFEGSQISNWVSLNNW